MVARPTSATKWDQVSPTYLDSDESIGPPSQYLGGKLRLVTLDNGVKAWAFGSCQYVQSAVKNVEEHLAKIGEKLPYRLVLARILRLNDYE